MDNLQLNNEELSLTNIKICDIEKIKDYLFFSLSNGQKILTNGKKIYDVSNYSYFEDLFNMNNKPYAVFKKNFVIYVVDLNNMEVVYEDKDAYSVSKEDNRTLHVIKKINCGNNTLYDIETKKYLPMPENYEFEQSLGNNLYVFREQGFGEKDFHEYNRCIINADGKFIMKNIQGWIYLNNNYLIINKKDELSIVEIKDEQTLSIKSMTKNNKILAKPCYYKGNILLIMKDSIKIYTPSLELIKEIKVDNLDKVIDYELIDDTLKLLLPYYEDGKKINKHYFIDLEKVKTISHLRIDSYPYWNPSVYIGIDSINEKEDRDFHFYNKNYEHIITVNASSYENINDEKENMFCIKNNDNEKYRLLNAETGNIITVDYDIIKFPVRHNDGYGIRFEDETIDFFNENLEILFSNINYDEYKLDIYNFGYFIVNNYICIINHFIDGYGFSRDRVIIRDKDGNVLLNSIKHKCYPLGNFIQIMNQDESEFINTLTGELGTLAINTKVDQDGNINFNEIDDINNYLQIDKIPDNHILRLEKTTN